MATATVLYSYRLATRTTTPGIILVARVLLVFWHIGQVLMNLNHTTHNLERNYYYLIIVICLDHNSTHS